MPHRFRYRSLAIVSIAIRKLLILSAVGILLGSAPASAQTVPETVVSIDVEFWAAGVNPSTGTPLMPVSNILISSATCNLPDQALPGTTPVNPTRIFIDDPVNSGRDCQLAPTTSAGLLMSVPLGNNEFMTARARGATTISPRSAASNPFTRAIIPAPPAAPTGVKILP